MSTELKPGTVVKATTVGMDFGMLTYVPGDYGVVCDVDFSPEWFGVHWRIDEPKHRGRYMCHVGKADVEVVPEYMVGRIVGGDSRGVCAYCDKGGRR